jgi:hypothetical protein
VSAEPEKVARRDASGVDLSSADADLDVHARPVPVLFEQLDDMPAAGPFQ